jgi:hypothetical protein
MYSIFGYLLRHQAEVAAYLDRQSEHRDAMRQENERRFDPQGVRARLVLR